MFRIYFLDLICFEMFSHLKFSKVPNITSKLCNFQGQANSHAMPTRSMCSTATPPPSAIQGAAWIYLATWYFFVGGNYGNCEPVDFGIASFQTKPWNSWPILFARYDSEDPTREKRFKEIAFRWQCSNIFEVARKSKNKTIKHQNKANNLKILKDGFRNRNKSDQFILDFGSLPLFLVSVVQDWIEPTLVVNKSLSDEKAKCVQKVRNSTGPNI